MTVPSLYPISNGCLLEGHIIYLFNLKSVTVGMLWLQKIQINHKNLNFTIDFSDFWNCYSCL